MYGSMAAVQPLKDSWNQQDNEENERQRAKKKHSYKIFWEQNYALCECDCEHRKKESGRKREGLKDRGNGWWRKGVGQEITQIAKKSAQCRRRDPRQ